MTSAFEILSKKHKRSFSWKYFATSHGTGIVDGVGGRAKSIVRTAVMSKKADAPVVQPSSDFAGKLLEKTTVFHISQMQIDEHAKKLNPWEKNPSQSMAYRKCMSYIMIFKMVRPNVG